MMDTAANILSLDQAPTPKGSNSAVPGMDNNGRSEDSFSNVYRQEKSAQERSEVPGKKRSEEMKSENRVPERKEEPTKPGQEAVESSEPKPRQVAEKAEGKGPQQAAERMEAKATEEKDLPENANAEHGQERSSERHALLAELFKRTESIEEKEDIVDHELLELPSLPDETDVLLEAGDTEEATDALVELEEAVEEQNVVANTVDVEIDKEEVDLEIPLVDEAIANPAVQLLQEEATKGAEGDGDELAKRAASRADLLQQNTKQAGNEKTTNTHDLTAEELAEETVELDGAVKEALHQLERSNAKFESVLAAKNAQQNQMTAADLFQQLSDKMTMQPGGDRPVLSALGATQAAGAGLRPQTPAGMPSYVMDTPVESGEWGNVFSKRINFLVKNNVQVAELRLDPPEMGRVNIKIKMSPEGAAQIQFNAQQPAVREAIETAMPRLRELLSEGGIGLGNVDVSTQFSQRQNDNPGRFDGEFGKSGFANKREGENHDELEETVGGIVRQLSSDSLVDYYA